MPVQIIPAILSQTEIQYKQDVEKFINSRLVTLGWVHIDFMDNILVPNKSITPSVVAKYPLPVKKEAHPMVAYPLQWVNGLADAGFKRMIFHIEAKDDPIKTIKAIRSKNMEAGIAINMSTPLASLGPLINLIDRVLVMAIIPGFQKQPFIQESLDRIKKLKKMDWNVHISVDGAIRDKNAGQLIKAGADSLVVGSFLIRGKPDENLASLRGVL